ncbi:MAG TPA: NifU family protein [Gemmatimonadales bacterium]|nr:NifU family protein [Gemmatimonadales bacterium]
MTVPVKVIAKPVDDVRCTLLLSREAGDAPVARAVLGVAGIVEVVVAGAELTVTKGSASPPWSGLVAQLRYAVRAAMEQPDALPGTPESGPADDDTVYEVADRVCRTEINSWVAQHGGNVELVDVQDGVVVLRLSGGCQGCGMARVTLSQGIETALRRAIPGLRGVQDVTDHDAGTRPYFRPAGE